jgi:hypothetical protein
VGVHRKDFHVLEFVFQVLLVELPGRRAVLLAVAGDEGQFEHLGLREAAGRVTR